MKKNRILPALFLSTAALILGVGAPLSLPADTLQLKSGQKVEGEVISFDGKNLKIRSQFGAGSAEVPYPMALVEKVTLTVPPALSGALAEPVAAAVPVLEEYWKRWESFLAVPETDSGRVALALAKAHLASGKKKDAQTALGLTEAVRSRDWNSGRKEEATRLRLTALAASGKIEQAMEEASQLENLGGGDESGLAQARVRSLLLKADLAWKKLLKLEETWPKWQEMPEQRAEHSQLRQEALDGFVFGATFHPELSDLASEGLWKAVEAHHHLQQKDQAIVLAREITGYFPSAEFKPRAEQFLKQNPTPNK